MYIVQKKGFSYDDNYFTEVDNPSGFVFGRYDHLNDAVQGLKQADRKSFKRILPFNLLEFINFGTIDRLKDYHELKAFYKANFNPKIRFDPEVIEIPREATDNQIDKILELSQLSFHNIVQYDDDQVPLSNQQSDLDEF